MFRRKRSSSNPPRPGSTTPTAAAALAASQAFLAKKQSDLNLSNSAAAAALRSYTPTPTPIGQVQTKRMQRKGSVSSSTGGPERPTLQRRGSGSSMTERSFREPSPSPIRPPERPASSHGPYPKRGTDTPPPVPALPVRYASPNPSNQSAVPRSASVNMNTRRMVYNDEVLLNRAATPTARAPSATQQRQPSAGASDSNAAHLAANVANYKTNRGSVNYSRPMSPQNTPVTSRKGLGRTLSPEPQNPNLAGLSKLEADRIAEGLQGVAEKPVKKKKKAVESGSPGSHLNAQQDRNLKQVQASQPARDATSISTTSDPAIPSMDLENMTSRIPQGDAAPPIKKKKKKAVFGDAGVQSAKKDEGFGNAYPSDTDSVASDVSSTTDRSRPAASRKKGMLAKQPSIVREDREAEEKAEGKGNPFKKAAVTKPSGPTTESLAISAASPTPGIEKNRDAVVSSEPTPQPALDSTLSPSRALHFSAQPTYGSSDGTKHQPLGRSASPAKSAMKHSPSRGSSPSMLRTQGFAGSDVSDVGSGVSDDGSQASKKKKRSVRVSFDSTPTAVGQAASPVASDSPILMSPQNQTKRSSQLAHSQHAESVVEQSSDDLAIKPTPALPSFGSIRGKEAKQTSAEDSQSTPDTSAPALTVGSQQMDVQKAESKAVASSDQISEASRQPNFGNGKDRGPDVDSENFVPAIAVLPATPALDDMRGQDNEWLGMPGGFPGAPQSTSTSKTADPPKVSGVDSIARVETESSGIDDLEPGQTSGRSTPIATPATLGIAEPETEPVAAQHDPSTPHVGEVAESLSSQIESHKGEKNTEDDSVYSDAAEDQPDTEGDGFGSINAIVESPSVRPLDNASPPKSPLSLTEGPTAEPLKKVDSGESEKQRALGYLASLSPAQRAQLNQAALPGAVEETVVTNRTLRGKNSIAGRPKKTAAKPMSQPETKALSLPKTDYQQAHSVAPQANQKRPMSQPPLSTNVPPVQAPKSTPEPKALLQKKGRPISAVPMVDYTNAQTAASVKGTKASSASSGSGKDPAGLAASNPTKKGAKSKLGRTKSNDSDSDSSFKRARSAAPHTGKYQMKRSMRAGGPTGGQSPATTRTPLSTRATDRSSSMGASGRPGGMRMSMRDSSGPSQPKRQSLRSPPDASKAERTKSPSRLSFTLGSRSVKKDKISSTPKTNSVYSSRFGDSSDDEVGLPALRSSRFDDSSDDEPVPLAPVRGIPRRIDEGDSTDLEDSSVENVKAPNSGKSNDTQPTTVSAPSTKPGGSALAIGSMRSKSKANQPSAQEAPVSVDAAGDKEKKKRSFFSMSRKRKDEPSRVRNSVLGPSSPFNTPSKTAVGSPATPSSPVLTEKQVSNIKDAPAAVAVPPSPKKPKLRKRNTSQSPARGTDGWPLKPSNQTKETSPDRPQTSDGNASPANARPDIGNRRVTLQTAPTAAAIEQAGAAPVIEKKKRFQALRKAFGMKK